MNSAEIRAKFYAIAELAPNTDYAMLVQQLGDLMFARLQHTTETHNTINASIEALHNEFQELSILLLARLKDSERNEAEKIDRITDRIHTLSNRFVAVETKADDTIALLDLKLDEILSAISELTTSDGTKSNINR